jgi:acyl-CoA thioester hydrolase
MPHRDSFPVFRGITTRWMDNDAYGHVNNVVYSAWFDTTVNAYLIEHGVLDPNAGDVVGVVVETLCRYHDSVSFPEPVEAGLRVERIGTIEMRPPDARRAQRANARCARTGGRVPRDMIE